MKSPAARRYMLRFVPTMILYVVTVIGVSWTFDTMAPSGPLAWVLAALPAIPILAVIAIMGLYLKEEGDEFVRNVLVEAMLWGVGVTLAVTSVWGFLEIYADAPRLPAFWAFPIWCGSMGLAQPLVKRRFR